MEQEASDAYSGAVSAGKESAPLTKIRVEFSAGNGWRGGHNLCLRVVRQLVKMLQVNEYGLIPHTVGSKRYFR